MSKIHYDFSKSRVPLLILVTSIVVFAIVFGLNKRESKEINRLKGQIKAMRLGMESSNSKLISLNQKLKGVSYDVNRVKRVFVKVPTNKLEFSYNLNNLLLEHKIKVKTASISSSGKFLNVSLKAEGGEENVMRMFNQLTKRFPLEFESLNMELPESNLDIDMEFREVTRKP